MSEAACEIILDDEGACRVRDLDHPATPLGGQHRPGRALVGRGYQNGPRRGPAQCRHVQAVVIEKGLSHSLLGMSFLGELKTFQTTPAGLVLKQ